MTHHTHATSNSEPTAVDVLPGRFLPTPALATSDPLPADVARLHSDALGDKAVQRHAWALSDAMQRQFTMGTEALISTAVTQAAAAGITTAEWLQRKLEAVERATAEMKVEREAVYARTRALSARGQALRSEISRRHTAATGGLPRLRERLKAAQEPIAGGDAYRRALDLGIPEERLRGLSLHGEPEPRRLERERLEAELARVQGELQAFEKFAADSDVQHLAGMGLDHLIGDFVASRDQPL